MSTRTVTFSAFAALLALGVTAHVADARHAPSDNGNQVDPGPYAGPLAEKYAGTVVFSSAPIGLKDADGSKVYTSYTLGRPLYMRFWSKDSPHNLMPSCNELRFNLRAEVNATGTRPATEMTPFGGYTMDMDDAKLRYGNALSNDPARAFTTAFKFDASDREDAGESAVRTFNSLVVPQLHEGTNTLHIVVDLDCGFSTTDNPILAESTIDVNVKPGAKAAYLAKFGPKLARSPHPENARLAPQIVAAMKKVPDWANEEIELARVTSPRWEPIRNYRGVLVEYEIQAVIVVKAKKETNPEACRLFDMTYRRDAAGGSLYYYSTGNPRPFNCSAAR